MTSEGKSERAQPWRRNLKCQLCGEPMPKGEEMFNYHGYSGPCPKPPLPKAAREEELRGRVFDALAEARVAIVRECDGEEMAEDVEAWSTREQYDIEQYTNAIMKLLEHKP